MVVFPHADASGGRLSGRARAVGLVAALALGLVVAAIWLLAGRGETPDSVAAPSQGADGAAASEARSPARGGGAPELVLPDSTPAGAAALQAVPATVAEAWRDIRGVTVRASDGSPVWSATVIALERDVAGNRMAERAQARTDLDGNFTLHMPQDVEAFRVIAPAPGRSRDDPHPGKGRDVAARIEWENGDPTASSVRLVLETGWRLDLRVLDGAGSPRAGVVVRCADRIATSDADGRCALLDLPVDVPSVTLGLQAAPDAKSVSLVVEAPEAGRLVHEARLTLP